LGKRIGRQCVLTILVPGEVANSFLHSKPKIFEFDSYKARMLQNEKMQQKIVGKTLGRVCLKNILFLNLYLKRLNG
jgi:hypothetical protein